MPVARGLLRPLPWLPGVDRHPPSVSRAAASPPTQDGVLEKLWKFHGTFLELCGETPATGGTCCCFRGHADRRRARPSPAPGLRACASDQDEVWGAYVTVIVVPSAGRPSDVEPKRSGSAAD